MGRASRRKRTPSTPPGKHSTGASTDTKSPVVTPAPLWKRFAAMFYDFLLVIALGFITTFIYLAAFAASVGGFDQLKPLVESGATAGDPTLKAALFLVTFFFFAYFWRRLGQTLGMQVWRIKVISADGRRLTWVQCILRFFTALLSLACFGLGFFWALWDKDGLTWHDRYAETRVINVPRNTDHT